MRQALELLREYFDHVIIDTPPILSVTDSRILARMTDGVILVIRSGETPKQVLRQAQKNLQLINAHILGVLVNAADLASADYYYYSKYYYYQYYNEDTGKKRSRRHRGA
jgi:succinoglycan biosynthesis transport protein ExoP